MWPFKGQSEFRHSFLEKNWRDLSESRSAVSEDLGLDFVFFFFPLSSSFVLWFVKCFVKPCQSTQTDARFANLWMCFANTHCWLFTCTAALTRCNFAHKANLLKFVSVFFFCLKPLPLLDNLGSRHSRSLILTRCALIFLLDLTNFTRCGRSTTLE